MSINNPENKLTTGIQLPKDAFVVIVRTEWNDSILNLLESGAKKVLESNECRYQVLTVPGAFEIPFAIKNHWEHVSQSNMPSAYIALGCVIRGDTPHFDYVCKAATDGVLQLNLMLPVPTIFGVLTVDNELQAMERLGGKHGHKGEEAALTALKMMDLMIRSNS
jgi:6,7-dimethyl-8-ribityllumazine synthase